MISLASSGWSQLMYFTYCELPRGLAICIHFRDGAGDTWLLGREGQRDQVGCYPSGQGRSGKQALFKKCSGRLWPKAMKKFPNCDVFCLPHPNQSQVSLNYPPTLLQWAGLTQRPASTLLFFCFTFHFSQSFVDDTNAYNVFPIKCHSIIPPITLQSFSSIHQKKIHNISICVSI